MAATDFGSISINRQKCKMVISLHVSP